MTVFRAVLMVLSGMLAALLTIAGDAPAACIVCGV